MLSFYCAATRTRASIPNVGSTQLVDARTLGFQDVLDAQGNVIYPAEAFLYGGRTRIVLPGGMEEYARNKAIPSGSPHSR